LIGATDDGESSKDSDRPGDASGKACHACTART
jgi:hypothetical protein